MCACVCVCVCVHDTVTVKYFAFAFEQFLSPCFIELLCFIVKCIVNVLCKS